jgi:putative sterol carrier protein
LSGDDGLTVEELLVVLAATIDPAKTHGEHATYRFEIAGAGSWLLAVDDGSVSLAAGAENAGSVLRLEPTTLAAIVRGEQSLVSAFLRGALAVEGDLLMSARLDRFRR